MNFQQLRVFLLLSDTILRAERFPKRCNVLELDRRIPEEC